VDGRCTTPVPAGLRGGQLTSQFTQALNEQIASEFAASQQYVAIAVHYDAQTLPQLATRFYRQAVEERNHAMMIVRYLLDSDGPMRIPGVEAPQASFDDDRGPAALALEQEKHVTAQIARLVDLARKEGDHVGEQFLGWFLAEQREEVASASALLAVIDRAGVGNMLLVEAYLAQASVAAEEPSGSGASRSGRRTLERRTSLARLRVELRWS
jgi:bacterioferritin B